MAERFELCARMIEAENREALSAAGSLEERIRIAMRAGAKHWMFTDDDSQFRGSLGAAMLSSTEDERDAIVRSLQPLQTLSAALNGVPLDWDAVADGRESAPLPLLKWWHEEKEASDDGNP